MQIRLKLFWFIWIVGKIEYDELYDEQQLIYKRTPMDFIDHLWELLSRNKRKKLVISTSFSNHNILNRELQQFQRFIPKFTVHVTTSQIGSPYGKMNIKLIGVNNTLTADSDSS
jgi:hypothetical protein